MKCLDFSQLVIFSLALAKYSRGINLNPDHQTSRRLEQLGLIRKTYGGLWFGSTDNGYEVDQSAWNMMLPMAEFHIHDPRHLKSFQEQMDLNGQDAHIDPNEIFAALTKWHPAIRQRRSNQQD